MSAPWHLAVLIPARNEAVLLPRCLRSVQRACRALPRHVSTDVIVVADCCTDSTEHLATTLLGDSGLVCAATLGVVGAARSLAATLALERLPAPREQCWLANTDADCTVPEDWLVRQLIAAQTGTDALAGTVDIDSFAEHAPHVAQRFRQTYLWNDDGTHPHVHGANLGVRAEAYISAGGWAPLATAEDHDLWGRLRRRGLRCTSDASFRVITSGRRVGRAPQGFAAALAAHNEVA